MSLDITHTAVGAKPDIFKMDPHLTLRFPPFLGKDLPNFSQACDQGHDPLDPASLRQPVDGS